MHCYQASKVSHLTGTVHTSQNHYSKLPASSLSLLRLPICKVIFAVTKAGNVRPDYLPERPGTVPLPAPWLPACLLGHCWGSGQARGNHGDPSRDSLQLWLQARSQPVMLTCLSCRSMVTHTPTSLKPINFLTQLFMMKISDFFFFLYHCSQAGLFTLAAWPRLYCTARPASSVPADSHLQTRIMLLLITFYCR